MSKNSKINIEDFLIKEDTSVYDAMGVIDKNGHGIAFVCDGVKLLATVTDGDIRRFIINRGDLLAPIGQVANYHPISNNVNSPVNSQAIMQKYKLIALPITDSQGNLISIIFQNQSKVTVKRSLNAPVVIMAGGKGTRLHPYTQVLPKPLIPVGEKTIIEHIMNRFEEAGCHDFYIIINYKKGLIKAYFSDMDNLPFNVHFIEEEEFLGTGGSLSLLANKLGSAFFFTNCDTLIDTDYVNILHQHISSSNLLTMICAMTKQVIPYGVIEMSDNGRVLNLTEKPSYERLVNTGIYVISPEFLSTVPPDTAIHITELIQRCIGRGEKIGVYPVGANAWMDMGQIEELEKMRKRLEETR